MAATLLLVALLATPWLVALVSWRLRNWRAMGVLMVGSATILAAGVLQPPFTPWLQGALGTALLWFVLTGGVRLSVIPGEEYEFIEKYLAVSRRIPDLRRTVLRTDPAAFVSEFEAVVDGLAAIRAPSVEWADLQADAVRALRRRLVLMKLGAEPPSGTLARARAEWSAIDGRFQRIVKSRNRFWAGFPLLTSRPED